MELGQLRDAVVFSEAPHEAAIGVPQAQLGPGILDGRSFVGSAMNTSGAMSEVSWPVVFLDALVFWAQAPTNSKACLPRTGGNVSLASMICVIKWD